MKRRGLFLGTAIALSWMARLAGASEEPDEMCAELERFARAVTDKQPHTVKLMTDWSYPEYARACKRNDQASEATLCNWLVENTSTEFMAINVARALGCMGLKKEASFRPYIESLAGEVYDPNFTAKDVELRITFDSDPDEGLPWLEITVTNYTERIRHLTMRWSDP